jgi:hypothetical protein
MGKIFVGLMPIILLLLVTGIGEGVMAHIRKIRKIRIPK